MLPMGTKAPRVSTPPPGGIGWRQGAGPDRHRRGSAEGHDGQRAGNASVQGRVLQPIQQRQFRAAGQRINRQQLRADYVGAEPAHSADGAEGGLLRTLVPPQKIQGVGHNEGIISGAHGAA